MITEYLLKYESNYKILTFINSKAMRECKKGIIFTQNNDLIIEYLYDFGYPSMINTNISINDKINKISENYSKIYIENNNLIFQLTEEFKFILKPVINYELSYFSILDMYAIYLFPNEIYMKRVANNNKAFSKYESEYNNYNVFIEMLKPLFKYDEKCPIKNLTIDSVYEICEHLKK